MKIKYINNCLCDTDYSIESISTNDSFIDDCNRILSIDEIVEDKIHCKVPDSKYPYYFIRKLTKEQFKKEYSKIIFEGLSDDFSFENVIELVRNKDNRAEFVKELSHYLDSIDVNDLIEQIAFEHKKEYNEVVDYMKDNLETYTDYKVVRIDSLEKEYLYEQFMEQLNKI